MYLFKVLPLTHGLTVYLGTSGHNSKVFPNGSSLTSEHSYRWLPGHPRMSVSSQGPVFIDVEPQNIWSTVYEVVTDDRGPQGRVTIPTHAPMYSLAPARL